MPIAFSFLVAFVFAHFASVKCDDRYIVPTAPKISIHRHHIYILKCQDNVLLSRVYSVIRHGQSCGLSILRYNRADLSVQSYIVAVSIGKGNHASSIIAVGTDCNRSAEHQTVSMTLGKRDGVVGGVIGDQASALFFHNKRKFPPTISFTVRGKVSDA